MNRTSFAIQNDTRPLLPIKTLQDVLRFHSGIYEPAHGGAVEYVGDTIYVRVNRQGLDEAGDVIITSTFYDEQSGETVTLDFEKLDCLTLILKQGAHGNIDGPCDVFYDSETMHGVLKIIHHVIGLETDTLYRTDIELAREARETAGQPSLPPYAGTFSCF
jgi:hypothetical protein